MMKIIEVVSINLHKDERGFLFSPFQEEAFKDIQPQHFHVYTIEPGSMRGNHVHNKRNEYILSFLGSALLAVFDPHTKAIRDKHFFTHSYPECAIIPANTFHCLYNYSDSVFVGASFSDKHCPDKEETKRSGITVKDLREIITRE